MSAQNNSTNTSVDSIDRQSIQALRSLSSAFAGWLLIGVLALVSNTLSLLTIGKSKSLHTKYFFSLASLSLSGCVCGVTYIYQGLKKTYLAFSGLPETSTQISCLRGFVPLLWATGLSDCLTFALNTDRFLALALPILYKQRLSKGYVITLNAACWSAPAIFWSFSSNLEDPNRSVAVCVGSTAPDKWFAVLYTDLRWAVAAPNLILFATTLIILKRRLDKTKSLGANERRAAKEAMELGMVKTMAVIVALYVLLKLGGYAVLTIAVQILTGTLQGRVNAFAGIMPGAYAASHFWLYLIMSKDFRKSFTGLLMKKKVSPTTNVLFVTSSKHVNEA